MGMVYKFTDQMFYPTQIRLYVYTDILIIL